jgi:hypothetical protein
MIYGQGDLGWKSNVQKMHTAQLERFAEKLLLEK